MKNSHAFNKAQTVLFLSLTRHKCVLNLCKYCLLYVIVYEAFGLISILHDTLWINEGKFRSLLAPPSRYNWLGWVMFIIGPSRYSRLRSGAVHPPQFTNPTWTWMTDYVHSWTTIIAIEYLSPLRLSYYPGWVWLRTLSIANCDCIVLILRDNNRTPFNTVSYICGGVLHSLGRRKVSNYTKFVCIIM